MHYASVEEVFEFWSRVYLLVVGIRRPRSLADIVVFGIGYYPRLCVGPGRSGNDGLGRNARARRKTRARVQCRGIHQRGREMSARRKSGRRRQCRITRMRMVAPCGLISRRECWAKRLPQFGCDGNADWIRRRVEDVRHRSFNITPSAEPLIFQLVFTCDTTTREVVPSGATVTAHHAPTFFVAAAA